MHIYIYTKGGGGCAFTMVEPRTSPLDPTLPDPVLSLMGDLEKEGYRCYESRIAGAGVLWV
jgi:hypothetical protein